MNNTDSTSPTPLRRILDLLPELLDPHFGIFTYIVEHPADPDSPRLFRYVAHTADTRGLGFRQNFANGGGAAITRDDAIIKSIGEGVERYCSAIYDRAELPLCSYADASFDCVHPDEFTVYASSQYEQPGFIFQPFNQHTPICWVAAIDLSSGQPYHVPAALVYTPYQYVKHAKDTPISQTITTGLACHCSQTEAIIAGLCEVIERDAFTITWQAQLTRPKISLSSLSTANKELVSRFQLVGYAVHLVNITMDNGIPTVMAILRNDNQAALPFTISASADMDPEKSVKKALEELGHTERHAVHLKRELPPQPQIAGFTNVNSQTDHLQFWAANERSHLTNFLTDSTVYIDFAQLPNLASGDMEDDLTRLTQNITQTGHKALFCDVTSADIASLGMSVIRAIIPGYQPLVMGHQIRALGNKRLWQLPQQLGLTGRTQAQGDYPYPHPFP